MEMATIDGPEYEFQIIGNDIVLTGGIFEFLTDVITSNVYEGGNYSDEELNTYELPETLGVIDEVNVTDDFESDEHKESIKKYSGIGNISPPEYTLFNEQEDIDSLFGGNNNEEQNIDSLFGGNNSEEQEDDEDIYSLYVQDEQEDIDSLFKGEQDQNINKLFGGNNDEESLYNELEGYENVNVF